MPGVVSGEMILSFPQNQADESQDHLSKIKAGGIYMEIHKLQSQIDEQGNLHLDVETSLSPGEVELVVDSQSCSEK